MEEVTFENLLAFEAEGEVNQVLRQDTDFDGTGDGLLVDENFLAYNLPITGTGDNLLIEVIFEANDGNVEFAIDDFSITATVNGSAQLELVDSVAGTFIDISTTGTALGFVDDGGDSDGDDAEADFVSTFLGANVRVGNNGGVAIQAVGELSELSFGNRALPVDFGVAFGASEVFLPFWDDLDSDLGDVFVQDFSDRFIVQWENRPHFNGAGATDGVTFQVQIFGREGTAGPGDIIAQYLYEDVTFAEDPEADNGAEATIGYQTDTTNAVQFSFDTASVNDGDVLTLRFEPDFLVGDVDRNQTVDFLDIAPFISLLTSGVFQVEADIDDNGAVNFLDIAPFIQILTGT